MYNEKKRDYTIKYARENLKRIPLDVSKDYFENTLKPAAAACNMAVNAFIKEAIQEKIDKQADK